MGIHGTQVFVDSKHERGSVFVPFVCLCRRNVVTLTIDATPPLAIDASITEPPVHPRPLSDCGFVSLVTMFMTFWSELDLRSLLVDNVGHYRDT